MTDLDPPSQTPDPFRILFVCTGNTCRSPMAEAIAREALGAMGLDHVEVRSAGVTAGPGAPATPGAVRAAAEHGLDLAGHASQSLTPGLIAWADLILTMSWRHAELALAAGGDGKTAMLTSYAAGSKRLDAAGVPDPFGGGDDEYRAAFQALERLVGSVLTRLQGGAS